MEGAGMLVVLVRGADFIFWSRLPNAGHLFVERWFVSRPVWRFWLNSFSYFFVDSAK